MSEVINIKELNERIERESVFVDTLRSEMGKVIIGQNHLIDTLLIGLLSNGHILLKACRGWPKRWPSPRWPRRSMPISRHSAHRPAAGRPDRYADLLAEEGGVPRPQGPVFANFVLADEINRSPAKVQSALLEAMQERQVTIGDETYPLPEPFLVLATQNPLEQKVPPAARGAGRSFHAESQDLLPPETGGARHYAYESGRGRTPEGQ